LKPQVTEEERIRREELLGLCRCSECPLNDGRRVFGEGSLDLEKGEDGIDQVTIRSKYDVVFVGMAPAREELAYGRPFVGPSGRLLRTTAYTAEYPPYYVTNTLLCWLFSDLTEEEKKLAVECCKARLFEELKSIGPRLIIPLGNMPLEALTGVKYKITEKEGRILGSTLMEAPLLPIEHPAAILRRVDRYRDFCAAMEYGSRWLERTVKVAGSPEWEVVIPENVGGVLEELEKREEAAIDIETTKNGLFPYNRDPDKIRCIGVSAGPNKAFLFPGYPSAVHGTQYQNMVVDPRVKTVLSGLQGVYHNGQFDCGFLKVEGYDPVMKDDTLLMHYMMDERGKSAHRLKKLAFIHLGAGDWEAELSRWKGENESYDKIPDDVLYNYCAHDTCYTLQLRDLFRKKMGDSRIYDDLLMPCANMFNDIRHKGLLIDVEVMMELDKVLAMEMEKAEGLLRDLCGFWVNPCSPLQVQVLMYDVMRFPVTRDYGRSTAEEALEAYREHPIIREILEYRGLNKLRGSYVDNFAGFLDSHWRVHPLIKLYAAVTGRIASENPAVMNIPKRGGVKRMFLPEPGHEILEVDQKQMELRCYAMIAGDVHLKDLLIRAEIDKEADPHRRVAREAMLRMGRPTDEDSLTDFRRTAKTAVFGRLYGRGLRSIMLSFGLTRDEAQGLVDVIDSLFPSIPEHNRRCRQAVHQDHELTTYFGRKRRFGLITEEARHELYRMAANYETQSLASDVNLFCMLHLYGDREVRSWGFTPLFPVHDSIVFDSESRENLGRLGKRMREFCGDLVENKMEFDVDMKIGPNWEDTKEVQIKEEEVVYA
jgi:uracil-DNA glycosylase family 4